MMKLMPICTKMLLMFFVVSTLTAGVGCGHVVPPGKTVIILTASGKSKVVEEGVYRAWGRDRLYFVDRKLKSFSESMKILCADDINMDVDLKVVISFNVDPTSIDFIKTKVPAEKVDGAGDVTGFELSLKKFYGLGLKDIIRGTARNVVSTYITDDIRPNRQKIEAKIAETVKKRIKDLKYPILVSAVLVSNIDYPDSVKKMRQDIKNVQLGEQLKAAAAQAELAEAERRVAVETEKAKVRLVKARAQADENKIVSAALTEKFLMWRQLEVLERVMTELAQGQNNTVFLAPYHAMNPDFMNTAIVKDSIDDLSKSVAGGE